MNSNDLLSRISSDPKIFGGKPIVRGLRISVESVLGQLAQGHRADLDAWAVITVRDGRVRISYAPDA